MNKRVRSFVFIFVVQLGFGAIFFGGKPEPASAQDAPLSQQKAPFKTYVLGIYCGSAQSPTAGFIYHVQEDLAMGSTEICAGKCGGGTVSLSDALAPFPAEVVDALKAQVALYEQDVAAGNGQPPLPCLRAAKAKPAADKKPKCEPPSTLPSSPWLDRDQPCKQWQRGVVSWKHLLAPDGSLTADIAYTVKLCGETINYALKNGARGDPGRPIPGDWGERPTPGDDGLERREPGARGFDVCCESWLKAANSRSPCDARQDIDCDEAVNEADRFPEIPEDPRRGSDFFVMKAAPWPADAGSQLDPPWNYLHAPDQSECKDCKWELIKYEFTKREIPDRIRSDQFGVPIMNTEYRFKTLWKCPVTGQTKENYEVVTKRPRAPGGGAVLAAPG